MVARFNVTVSWVKRKSLQQVLGVRSMNDVVTGTTLVVVPPLPTLLGLCVVSRLLVLSEI